MDDLVDDVVGKTRIERDNLKAEIERLKSELAKAHADAATLRGALDWAHQKLDDADIPFLNTFLDSLSTNSGRDLLARYREAVELLRDFRDNYDFGADVDQKIDTLLSTVKWST